MSLITLLKNAWKNPVDVWYFIQGTLRYRVYRTLPELIPAHIKAQYEQRKRLAEACYRAGECRCCGCRTPELFFASKACSISALRYAGRCKKLGAPCYGRLLTKRAWNAHSQNPLTRG